MYISLLEKALNKEVQSEVSCKLVNAELACTDEDPSLRIGSFAIINLRCVSTKV